MSKTVKNILKVGVSVVLIILLLTQIDVRAIGAELISADPWWLLISFLLFVISILLRAVRWKVLLDALEIRVPYWLLARWYYIGAFFNTLLPTGFGGDVVRSVALAQYSKQVSSAVGTVIIDRFLGILVLLALGAAAIPFARAEINPVVQWSVLVLFLGAAGGFWLLRRERLVRWCQHLLLKILPDGLAQRLQQMEWIKPFYDALQGYDRRTLAKALLASLIFNLNWILINISAGKAVGVEASLVDYLVLVPLVSLALLVPSFGGLGVRELSYVGLFAPLGVPPEKAFAMSIVIYAVTVATGLLGGVLILIQNLQQARVKQNTEAHGGDAEVHRVNS